MMVVRVHLIVPGQNRQDFITPCPARNQAMITINSVAYNLLPDGDGFDQSVYDQAHNAIWYRDVCPIDTYITAFVSVLPTWTTASIAAHPEETGYVLVASVWTDLFMEASTWLRDNVLDDDQRAGVQNVLSTIILNWFVANGWVVME